MKKELSIMTYKEYKSVVIKYLLRCLEIEVQDRFVNMQCDRIKDGSPFTVFVLTSEDLEFNLIITDKYLRAERARLYSAIDEDILRETTPRQLRQILVTEYLNDVSDREFLNAVRVTNCKPGSRQPIKYYLVGGIV